MAYPTGWTLLQKITIDHTKISGTSNLSNYTLLIKEDQILANTFDNTDNGGGDVRFSSDVAGSSQLACEVIAWDTSADTCIVWIKVPTVSYTVDTVIYLWGNNTGQTQPAWTDDYGRNSVWTNYASVIHGIYDETGDSSTFELGTAPGWTLTVDAAVATDQKYAGSYSLKLPGNTTATSFGTFPFMQHGLQQFFDVCYISFRWRCTSSTSGTYYIFHTSEMPYALVARGGHFMYYDGSTYQNLPSDKTFAVDTWYLVEIWINARAGTYGQYAIEINGASGGTVERSNYTITTVGSFRCASNSTAGRDSWYDNVYIGGCRDSKGLYSDRYNDYFVHDTAGKIDRGMHFDGSTDYIAYNAGLKLTGAHSLEVWYNPDITINTGTTALGVQPFIGGKPMSTAGAQGGYSLAIYDNSNGKVYYDIYDSDERSADNSTTTTWTAGTWYYISGGWQGTGGGTGGQDVIVNGSVEDSTGSADIESALAWAGSAGLNMGSDGNLSYFLDGSLEEARIASVYLTTDYRITNYTNQSAPATFSTGSLVSNIKTVVGLAKSSVKTVNGLAIASVGSVDGLE